MSEVRIRDALSERLRRAQHTLDDAEFAEDRAFDALKAARKAREVAANEVFNLQEKIIDALRVV